VTPPLKITPAHVYAARRELKRRDRAELTQGVFAPRADDGSQVRFRVMKGGRGSGKSHGFAEELIERMAARKTRVLCCREIQKSIRDSVKALLVKKIKELHYDKDFDVLDTEIRHRNGSLATFVGLRTNIESVKSTEDVDIAYVSEARTVSQSSWEVLTPTIRNEGSEIWADYNPKDEKDPVDAMFAGKDGPPPGSIVRHINYTDNKHFPEVLRREMEYDRQRDPEKYQHVWLGQHKKNSEARVFKNVRVEPVPTPPPGTVFRFGADWGFSVDPSVLLRMWIDGRTLYIDREAYRVGCETLDLPKLFAGKDGANEGEEWTPALEAAYPGIEDAKRWTITADSARPETISHMNKRGFKVVPARKGAGSINEGIEWLQSYDIVIDPQCIHAEYEFTSFAFKIDPLTNQVLPILEEKDNHLIDAARYGTEALRKPKHNLAAWG
jgi:phage terminase large subunit